VVCTYVRMRIFFDLIAPSSVELSRLYYGYVTDINVLKYIFVKPDHKDKNLAMWRKIHVTNFFRIKLLDRTNIKCQNEPVLPPAQVFIF
jgi:hypothetical protein